MHQAGKEARKSALEHFLRSTEKKEKRMDWRGPNERGNLCPRFAEASSSPLFCFFFLSTYKSSFNSPPFFPSSFLLFEIISLPSFVHHSVFAKLGRLLAIQGLLDTLDGAQSFTIPVYYVLCHELTSEAKLFQFLLSLVLKWLLLCLWLKSSLWKCPHKCNIAVFDGLHTRV